MDTKPWYQSKLVWMGVLTALLGIIPLVQEMIDKGPVDTTAILTLVSGVIVIALRVWTNSPINPIQK
jgi:hypothetical protein